MSGDVSVLGYMYGGKCPGMLVSWGTCTGVSVWGLVSGVKCPGVHVRGCFALSPIRFNHYPSDMTKGE